MRAYRAAAPNILATKAMTTSWPMRGSGSLRRPRLSSGIVTAKRMGAKAMPAQMSHDMRVDATDITST